MYDQDSTAYRLNYLWYTKQAIADAINDVGKNKGISVNPRQDFAKFAEKILKLQTSVWSSAFIQVEPVGNENPRAEHWFEYIDEYFQPSEDIIVNPSKQYYKQPPHALTITENGYYKVSDLSLREFGEADAKTVASSFYVSVQSAPIIIGDKRLEYGKASNRGTKTPVYDFDETITGDSETILDQLASRLGIVMGAQAVKEGDNWFITFDNGKTLIFRDLDSDRLEFAVSSPSFWNQSTDLILIVKGPAVNFKIIKNTKAIFLSCTDARTGTQAFVIGTTSKGCEAAFRNLGTGECLPYNMGNARLYVVFDPELTKIHFGCENLGDFPAATSEYSDTDVYPGHDYYIMYNSMFARSSYYGVEMIDFGENLFLGPKVSAGPKSYSINNSEFTALLDNSCFWQRL